MSNKPAVISFEHDRQAKPFGVRLSDGHDRAPRLTDRQHHLRSGQQAFNAHGIAIQLAEAKNGLLYPVVTHEGYYNGDFLAFGSSSYGWLTSSLDVCLHGVSRDLNPDMTLEPGELEIIDGVSTHMNGDRFDRIMRFPAGTATATVHLAFST